MSYGDQSSRRNQEQRGAGDPSKEREKKGWFHSLTRHKKSNSSLAISSSSSSGQNNNNEVCVLEASAMDSSMASCSNGSGTLSGTGGTLRRRREKRDRNVFARLRRKVGQGLSSLRNWHSMGDNDCDGGTTDATYEFLTPPIRSEPTLPFTHDYLRFIRKKWLEREDAHCPNQVMFKACSEMLK